MAAYYGNDPDDDQFNGFDTYYGGEGNDALGQDDRLSLVVFYGGNGNDTLYIEVGGGPGHFYGGDGNDWMFSAIGVETDYMYGGLGTDVLEGGPGDDYLDAGQGSDALFGSLGNDRLYGGDGDDIRMLFNAGSALGPGVTTAWGGLYGADGDDLLDGGQGNDHLQGGEGADRLLGGDGNDRLWANVDFIFSDSDVNVLSGGDGNDTCYVGNPLDKVIEAVGGGSDIVFVGTYSYVLAAGQEIERLQYYSGISTVTVELKGNAFGQHVVGNNGTNFLDGGGGNDIIIGLADWDTLIGGGGKDALTGGAHPDAFVFNAALGPTNIDTITDFSHADDTIRLDNAVFTKVGANGALNPGFFFVGAAAHDANDRIIYNKANGAIYYDADGLGGQAQILFAVLAGKPANVAANDFVVI